MASRLNLSRFRDKPVGDARSTASSESAENEVPISRDSDRPVITSQVVDEAVNNVLGKVDYPGEVKEIFRKLLASDTSTGFATHFFTGKADFPNVGLHPRLARRQVHIPQVLTPEETSDLVAYAPELDLVFHDVEGHDHAMAAAMRRIDTELIHANLPNGISMKDVGGDPLFYVDSGKKNVHVCNPLHDPKDPSRGTVREMRVAKLARNESRSEETRELAQAYLSADKEFVCGGLAQECSHSAKVSISIHVYDVKMEDWPVIMDKAGSLMHSGVVLYPSNMYSASSGELKAARARYEIDAERNEFRMGFVGSPSWWYTHSWMDFMRYGSDQIISYNGSRYSYKVTERRGDTLFFQILKVASDVTIERQWYKLPTVPMVKVDGYEYAAGEKFSSIVGQSPLKPRVYWFPGALWDDMLQHASMEFERGVMTYDRLYNYYRVVSPRNTINGVLVSGGQRVSANDIVALITHVGICAATSVMLAQKTSRAITSEIMAQRGRSEKQGPWSGFKRFLSSLAGVSKRKGFTPLTWFSDQMDRMVSAGVSDALVSWSHEPMVREVPVSELVGDSYMKEHVNWDYNAESIESEMRGYYLKTEENAHLRALKQAPALTKILTELCIDQLSPEEAKEFRNVAEEVVEGKLESVSVSGFSGTTAVTEDVKVARRSAIQECIDESTLEQRKLEQSCEKIFRACTDARGQPIERLLRDRAEEYFQPDFWEIRNGIVIRSVLGLEPHECRYSALFTLREDSATGSRFRSVLDERYVPAEGVLYQEEKDYKIFSDSLYTGWAFSFDRLQVYNGPEICHALEKALGMQHDYVVEVRQGPPGCGKTYSLLKALKHEDVAMCPVRESAIDTRKRLTEDDPLFPDPRLRVRTVDSYLVNYESLSTQSLVAKQLHADEVYMTHAGKWYAAAALLGVSRVVAYGDDKQIPHIPRVQAKDFYLRIRADIEYMEYLTKRCPHDTVAAFASVYGYRVRSDSTVVKSMVALTDRNQLNLKQGHVILCMYQAEKKELKKMYALQIKSKGLKILTTHESEGKTYRDVMLYRGDTRPREDKMSLYDQSPHVLVAISRHTHTFAYVRSRKLNDLVDEWMAYGSDPRAIAAAGDVETAGQVLRYK